MGWKDVVWNTVSGTARDGVRLGVASFVGGRLSRGFDSLSEWNKKRKEEKDANRPPPREPNATTLRELLGSEKDSE